MKKKWCIKEYRTLAYCFFYNLWNCSAINTLAIFISKHINTKVFRIYVLETVCWELVKTHIERRSSNACLPRELKSRTNILLKLAQKSERSNRKGNRGRCYECGRQRHKTTQKWCSKCFDLICRGHLRKLFGNLGMLYIYFLLFIIVLFLKSYNI